MHADTVKKLKTWQREDTRESKQHAKELRKGAFAVYLRDECINKQLAMSFLKFPSTHIDDLVHSWARYMASPEHQKEVKRSAKVDPENIQAVEEKDRQLRLKAKVHSLRHQIRHMKSWHDKHCYDEIPPHAAEKYIRWKSGEMQADLDALPREHGYSQSMQPPRFPDRAFMQADIDAFPDRASSKECLSM